MEDTLHCADRGIGYDRDLDPEVAERRNILFRRYITPYFNMIYKLSIKYTKNSEDIPENYNIVLTTLFRGIETYNPEKDIRTWIHIVTKRQIFESDKKRMRYQQERAYWNGSSSLRSDDEIEDVEDLSARWFNEDNYRSFYNDDILSVLDSMNPIHRDALILQEAGYSLKEIAEIEHRKGALDSRNIDTVKSRLFLARRTLRNKLTRNGTRKADMAD